MSSCAASAGVYYWALWFPGSELRLCCPRGQTPSFTVVFGSSASPDDAGGPRKVLEPVQVPPVVSRVVVANEANESPPLTDPLWFLL